MKKLILFFALAACSNSNEHVYMNHVLKVNDRARKMCPVFGIFDTSCVVSDSIEGGQYYCFGRTEKNVIVKFLCNEETCEFPAVME